MKSDFRLLLCCGLAWLCCGVVNCRAKFFDAKENALEKEDSLENEWFEKDNEVRILEDNFGRKPYHGPYRSQILQDDPNKKDICTKDEDCQNGGTCHKENKLCTCISGTSGETCDVVDDCLTEFSDCKADKGTCKFNVKSKKAECECPPNKVLSEDQKYCEDICTKDEDCENGGTCDKGNKVCTCISGTSGDRCDVVDDCLTEFSDCKEDKGTCKFNDKRKKAECECPPNKVLSENQKYCEDICTKDEDCQNGGTCHKENKVCTCISGTSGETCDVVDDCVTEFSDCKEDKGTCKFNVKSKKAECECPPNKVLSEDQKYCEEICTHNKDCQNGGTCADAGDGVKVCNCIKGTSGKRCEVVDACLTEFSDCKDDKGTCKFNVKDTKAECVCPLNKILSRNKKYCEDICTKDEDCQNGGTCDKENKVCTCISGTSGARCDVVDDCLTEFSDCKDDKGTCKFNAKSKKAECECPPNKILSENQKYCEEICTKDKDCHNGGKCAKENEVKECKCIMGTSGVRCEVIDDCSEEFKECKDDKGTCKFDVENEKAECECPPNKVLIEKLGYCKGPCTNDNSCKNGARCEGEEGEKYCDCLSGTSGDTCDTIDDCVTGIYKQCVGDKGNCTYNEEEEKAHCICEPVKEVKDLSGYCEACYCGANSTKCSFVNDTKTCECDDGYADKNGTCEKCDCGEKSKKCIFVKDQQKCECEDGYADNNGSCEKCDCGDNADLCTFNNGNKVCQCKENFKDDNGTCKECNCGENSESCKFQDGKKICKCKKNFQDNVGTCEECICGENSTSCKFQDEKKICTCKKDFADDDGTCKECKCPKNTKPCKFEHGEKICNCRDKYAFKDGNCTACNCGAKAKGCTFEGETKECECETGYADNKGICAEDQCFKICKVPSEGHEEVQCEGNKFLKNVTCKCFAEDQKFDYSLSKCRHTCSKEKQCENGAKCLGSGEITFCKCLKGTTGDHCEIVTDCAQGGKLEKCAGDKGECTYNKLDQKAMCKCTEKKIYDPKEGYCQDKCTKDSDCSEDKICFKNSYCSCEEGKKGENCEIATGCTEELNEICKTAGAICAFNRNAPPTFAACDCQDENLVFNGKKCVGKFCHDVGCSKPAECLLDDEKKTAYCKCPSGKYYDYSMKSCSEPDKCLLKKTPCKENEECKEGKCKCNYVEKDNKCIKPVCTDDGCFTGGKCDESGNCKCEEGKFYTGSECKELKCFQNPFQDGCACGSGMTRNKDTKQCEPKDKKNACDNTKCGLGYCISEKCSCINGISKPYKDKCVLDKDKVCATKKLTSDLSKCNCTGKYKLAKDGITCELVTCSDDAAMKDCKEKGATCQMTWKGTSPGYDCICPEGYVLSKEKGICTDSCSVYENALICSESNQVCYNSYSTKNKVTSTCGCAPPFTSKDGDCDEIAENFYVIRDIPVMKQKYEMQNSIDYVKLNVHVMQSLSQMYSKEVFDSGYVYNAKVQGDILKTSVWVRFKVKPSSELNKFMQQAQNFPNLTCDDCDPNLYLWPPSVVLNNKDIQNVKVDSLSMCDMKDTLCGKEAECENNKCYCPRGYRTLEYTIRNIGKARILRCEKAKEADLDECALGTHQCSKNTICTKIPGSYVCDCKPGYWKSTSHDKNDCADMCTPSPCVKGSCSMKNNKFNCKCPAGYSGSVCDEADVNFAAAKKSTVVVGAVLGTILIVAVIGALLFYIKKRKNSYSEDFMPAPRQDIASEMRERRPVRGVVNTSYE